MDLTMTRGDTPTFGITVTNYDGSVRDITGATLTMTARAGYSAQNPVFQVVQGSHTDPTQGESTITLTAIDTSGLPGLSILVYDVQLAEIGGTITTVQAGKFTVVPDVTT